MADSCAHAPLAEPFWFEGFRSPRYTQVPDEAFDVLMARLTPAEFKVMMYIVRRTFGFRKLSDAISLRQIVSGVRTRDGRALDHGTGLSKAGAVKAIQGLVGKGVLLTERQPRGGHRFDATVYRLRFADDPGQEAVHPEDSPSFTHAVHSVDTPSTPSAPTPDYSVDSQITVPDSESNKQPTVADSRESHDKDKIFRRLSYFGLGASASSALLADHGPQRLDEVLSWLEGRRQEGWRPRTTFAAWITACLRDGYQLPPPVTADPPAPAPTPPRYLPPGVSRAAATLWQAVVGGMRAEGEWTAILSACFLRQDAEAAYTILVPRREFIQAVADREEAIKRALRRVQGTDCQLTISMLERKAEAVRTIATEAR